MLILGTILNVAAIVMGGLAGLCLKGTPSQQTQATLRTVLGMVTVLAGLHFCWTHLHGGWRGGIKQGFVACLALVVGNVIGKALGLQNGSNRLGHFAGKVVEQAAAKQQFRAGDGFLACTVLFCIAPLTFLGCVQEGLSGDWRSFAIKSVVDAMAAMSFVGLFGWATLWVAIPVLAWQGSLTLLVALAAPWLQSHLLVDSILVTSGLLLCCVSVLILQTRKVRIADYLPSLMVAPLITKLVGLVADSK